MRNWLLKRKWANEKKQIVKQIGEKMITPNVLFIDREKYYQAYLVADRREQKELAIELRAIVKTLDYVCGKKASPSLGETDD